MFSPAHPVASDVKANKTAPASDRYLQPPAVKNRHRGRGCEQTVANVGHSWVAWLWYFLLMVTIGSHTQKQECCNGSSFSFHCRNVLTIFSTIAWF